MLRAVRGGELADRALADALPALEPRERAWLYELVMGVLRLRARLDARIEAHVRGGIARLEADVLDVLRLGAYQLDAMGSVPVYAAISQSVELVRWAGSPRAAGLVNGVLRALERARGGWDAAAGADPLERLSVHGSHPAWLVERWIERWGAERAGAVIEANNRRPELYVRPVGVTRDEALERLRAAAVECEPVPSAPDSIRLAAGAELAAAFEAAPLIVQDPAAALVTRYAAVAEGATLYDLCAAPGGKAVALAGLARRVVAADVSAGRMHRLVETRDRLATGNGVAAAGAAPARLDIVVADARQPPFAAGSADAVLIDAPCTGTGTLRRHPDGKWRLRPEDVRTLAALQREILSAAAELVRPGGVLVYATCSLEREENEEQVDAFLDERGDFTVRRGDDGIDDALLDRAGALVATPDVTGFDGGYAARLVRSR